MRKGRRVRDAIHDVPICCKRLRVKRLKVKKHHNKSKKSFYKTRFWELHLKISNGVDYRNHLKRNVIKALSRSKRVAISHRSMGCFHHSENNYNVISFTDAKTKKFIFKVDASMPEEEIRIRLAVRGYDEWVDSGSFHCIIE